MKRNTRIAKTFYKTRSLTSPKAEYWPESGKELLELALDDTTFIAVGGGQHIETKLIKTDSEVIRFGKMCDVLNFDKLSMLAKIEAGMTWGTYKILAKEHELSTFPYRLYPDKATLGGIVSRQTQNSRSLWDGALLNCCHGLRGISKLGDYRYLSAPKKASGPDLRSFWFGAGGQYGFVVDLTLGLFPIQEKLILRASGNKELLELPSLLENMGVKSAWTHGSVKAKKVSLDVGFSGSKRRLDAVINEIKNKKLPHKISLVQGELCEEVRNKIEAKTWTERSEKFVRTSELKDVKNATIVNASRYGLTILASHASKQAPAKWRKKLNKLTKTRGQK